MALASAPGVPGAHSLVKPSPVVDVTIGDRTQIGQGVQILAIDHPRHQASRASDLEFGRPVGIGRNVWVGAEAMILPGVSIGDDALIARAAWSPVT
jgi:acetyltransferase-like isoleucine patch superfamily enzyme